MLGVRDASCLPIYRAQAKVGHGTGGLQLESVLEKGFSLLRLIHGHQKLRHADVGLGMAWLQLQSPGVTLGSFLQIVSLKSDIAKPAFRLFIKRVAL